MKNIILFILLIILVIIYYKNYFSIKEDFKGLSSKSDMIKQAKPALDVPLASVVALNNTLQSTSGKKNDKEIEPFTGDRDIPCNNYTSAVTSNPSYNHFKDLYKKESKPKKLTEYLSGMVRESILIGCSGECKIDIAGIDNDGEICKNVEKIDNDQIKKRIPVYKNIIKELWSNDDDDDEREDTRSRWKDWEKYLSNGKDENYSNEDTYSDMPNKGLKPEVETSWF